MNNKSAECQTNSSGLVSGIPYHDGTIGSIDISNKEVVIKIVKDGILCCLELDAIYDFSITEFWYGAIVSNIYMWKLEHAPFSETQDGLGLNHIFGCRYDREGMDAARKRALRQNPEMVLLQIDCSYGGTLSFLCRAVRFGLARH